MRFQKLAITLALIYVLSKIFHDLRMLIYCNRFNHSFSVQTKTRNRLAKSPARQCYEPYGEH